jgi:hypothetical protein
MSAVSSVLGLKKGTQNQHVRFRQFVHLNVVESHFFVLEAFTSNTQKMNVIKALRDYIIKVVRITQGMKVLVLDAETVPFPILWPSIVFTCRLAL